MSKVAERAMAKRARRGVADEVERAGAIERAAAETVLSHFWPGMRKQHHSREALLRMGWEILANMAGCSAAEQAQIATPAQRIAMLEAMAVLERTARG